MLLITFKAIHGLAPAYTLKCLKLIYFSVLECIPRGIHSAECDQGKARDQNMTEDGGVIACGVMFLKLTCRQLQAICR